MNSSRVGTTLLLLLTLTACGGVQVGYDPDKCLQACEIDYRNCTSDTLNTPERAQHCREQHRQCRQLCPGHEDR